MKESKPLLEMNSAYVAATAVEFLVLGLILWGLSILGVIVAMLVPSEGASKGITYFVLWPLVVGTAICLASAIAGTIAAHVLRLRGR